MIIYAPLKKETKQKKGIKKTKNKTEEKQY
jgi:hypothetical protein